MKSFLAAFFLLVSAAWAQTVPECPTTTLVPGETATGALAATDCRVRDMIAGSTNASYAKRYRLEVESQAVFPVTIGSPDFPAAVSIYSGTVARTQVTALQGSTGRFTINLPPGTYTLYAFSTRVDATGSFELKADRQEVRPCPIGTLTTAGTTEGVFTESGCRFLDLTAFSISTAYVNFYQLETPTRGVLQLTADTAISNFSTVLSTQAGTAFRGLKQMTVSLLPGANIVSFASALAGSFTIRTTMEELRTCPQAPGKLGEETTGELTVSGCRWLDVFVPSDDPSPAALVRFSMDSRAIGQVDLRSTLFDSFLVLLNGRTGGTIAGNDNASTGVRDSRVLAHLPPGEYVAMATSVDGTGVGAFTLKFGSEAPRMCDAVKLTANEAANGTFPEGDTGCRLIDYMNFTTLLTPVAPFVFEPAEPTMTGVKVEGALASTVRLVSPSGQEVIRGATDRNGDLSTEFRIPAGLHNVLVTSTATPRPAFKVTAQPRAVPTCPADSLEFGAEVESVLTTVECKASELANYLPLPTPAKTFRVKVGERGTLRVRAESAEFGPFLAVIDNATATAVGSGAVPGNAGTLNLSGPVEPGEYTIAISSLGITVGAFKLQATFVPAGGGITAPVLTGEAVASVTRQPAEWPRLTRSEMMLPLESTSIVRRLR